MKVKPIVLVKVKNVMKLGDNFHMCDVSDISENGIHLESWHEDVLKSDIDQIVFLITADSFDIDGFELLEIPHPKVFCFGNLNTMKFFDVVKFFNNKWQFSYSVDSKNCLAQSIEDAINKYEIL